MKLGDLAALPLTYTEVGATAGPLPAGYHHVHQSAVIGHGRHRFDEAADAVMRWGMLRGAGVRVDATTEVAAVGSEVTAFSRHGTWWSRLAGPVTALVQRIVSKRYVKAV